MQAVAPIFSLVAPRFQFKGANKRGIPVSRDPAALLAKYTDPLVYTGPIRALLIIGNDPPAYKICMTKPLSKFQRHKSCMMVFPTFCLSLSVKRIAQDIINWMEKKLFTI
ncbi:uncharacterized protein LOC124844596 [Vigna umbellata]|uniref:uncharacterized protein LOC124844596 n=1 Tax=Vigna umbellata TaxID=87088 RepID=UPI001F5F0B7B|nr:uncharacterized protein LOC124844596 [Vigna umbellata]